MISKLSLPLVWILLLAAPVAIAGAADTTSSRETRRPNILFLMPDQWRAQAFGYSGDPNVKTPHIDRLARQSVDFRYAVASTPVCSPTRASLLTGQRPLEHGLFLNDAHLPASAGTFAEVLKEAGYDTAMIGKWHVDGHGRQTFIPRERRQGFDYWKVLECTHDYNKSYYYADTPEKLQWSGYDAIAQTRDAQQYIRDHANSEKPFLLTIWWGPPHNPYQTAPKEFHELYDPEAIQLRPNVPPADAEKARKALAGYYAHCSAIDQCVGDLMQTLRDAGIDDNTLIVFTSDHGDMLESQGLQRKQKPWDESIRVPMLWHYPDKLGLEGKSVETPMSSEDVMPTLLSLVGAPIPESVSGLDYAPFMIGGDNPNPSNAAVITCIHPFGEFDRASGGKEYRGIRTPRYTYVRDLNGPWLLFDNERDPYQLSNLIDNPTTSALQQKLNAILVAKLTAAGDAFEHSSVYLDKWGYADRVDQNGTLPTKP